VRALCEQVDWECDVLTNYSDVNLGCRRRVASGLDWVFEQVDRAIILEDDCLPHPSFFPFCEELLVRYRDDERIAMIGGTNLQPRGRPLRDSYYFSRYPHIWGWASWQRAWKSYDIDMAAWSRIDPDWMLASILGERRAVEFWKRNFDTACKGMVDTWDYQWVFACWAQSRLSILPRVNLISNIGFHADATHTVVDSPFANLPRETLPFPLRHPPVVVRDAAADQYTQQFHFGTASLPARLQRKMMQILRGSGKLRTSVLAEYRE
jgi:hypothetical protein